MQEIRAGLVEIDGFWVSGISIVTDNSKATDDINKLWEKFFNESVGQQISNKVNDNIYAVYSDYEGDHEAPYRLTIGYRLESSPSNDTNKFHLVKCQSGDYALMSAAGEQPKALIETWKAIWSGNLDRSFATDFELYGPRFFEAGVNEVLIHVGVKP